MLHWALTAAAVLMFLIAVRTLFISSKKDGSQSRQKLGCGFAFFAILLWVYVLHDYLGELGPAVTIGLAILLILPAVQAVADPGRARILRAVVGLILAILLAGPVVVKLWNEHGPDTRPKSVQSIEKKIDAAKELRAKLAERRAELGKLSSATSAQIKAFGNSWEEIEGNEEALKKLGALENIRADIATTDAALEKLAVQIPQLQLQLAARQKGEEAPAGGESIDDLLKKYEDVTPLEDLSIVEQYARKKELQELFEKDL